MRHLGNEHCVVCASSVTAENLMRTILGLCGISAKRVQVTKNDIRIDGKSAVRIDVGNIPANIVEKAIRIMNT